VVKRSGGDALVLAASDAAALAAGGSMAECGEIGSWAETMDAAMEHSARVRNMLRGILA
jgi:hypothetical protein